MITSQPRQPAARELARPAHASSAGCRDPGLDSGTDPRHMKFLAMEARPTLQDIARLSGFGKATVSLALRDDPKISLATRQRVKAIAEKLNYRPDPALARIAAHRWRTREHPSDLVIAFISMEHPDLHRETLPQLRLAATERGERLGYRVEHFRLEDHASPAQLARVLFHRGIRGVIVGQILVDGFVQQFPWDSFTCVGAHVGYYRPPVTIIVSDFHHAIVRAWTEAVQAGYRRIGVAMLREMQAVDLFDKVSATLFCQARLSPELETIPVQHFALDGSDEFAKWMQQCRPDVVLGFNNTIHYWLHKSGYRVPEEVGFVSFDRGSSEIDKRQAMVTGLDPAYELIGRTAIEQIDLLLRTNQSGIPERPLIIQVPSSWVQGNTLPPARTTKRAKARRGAASSS